MATKKYKYRTKLTLDGEKIDIRANSSQELAEKIAKATKEHEERCKIIKTDITVKEWSERCFEMYKTNIQPITLRNQKSKVNRWIIPEIGSMRVQDVREIHCQLVMNHMNGMAADTIKKVRQLMIFIFDKAMRNNLIRVNPAAMVMPPKGGKSTHRAITDIERQHILATAEKSPKYAYFLFMLYCGLRPSEAAEVKWSDIKTDNLSGIHLLHVRGTKTKNADREVPIPDYLYERIPAAEPYEYIFKNQRGGHLSEQNRQVLWKHFKRDLNIEMGCKVYRNELIPPFPVAPDLVPYCLRHTYCTDLQQKGIDIRTAQYLMGHSDIKLTANIYTHTERKTIVEAGLKLNGNDEKRATTVATMP